MDTPKLAIAPVPSEAGSVLLKVVAQKIATREARIEELYMRGAYAPYLANLCAIPVTSKYGDTGTIWVTPDYLSIGTNEDFVRTPMFPGTAYRLAKAFYAMLPTRKICDLILANADKRVPLSPLDKVKMVETETYQRHNDVLQKYFGQMPVQDVGLIAGAKKDIVLCRGLDDHHVAIYGGSRSDTQVWQSLNCTSHSNTYVDYSHGVRLVADRMEVNGEDLSTRGVLLHPTLSYLISDEGPFTAR